MNFALLAVAVAFAFICDIYDVTETEKGLKAGVAVEGNTFLIGTDKPTAVKLYLRDGVVIVAASVPAAVCLGLHAPSFFYAALAGPVVAGAKHILGGRAWVKLLAGQKPTPSEQIEPGANN
jgi:hypothetical protein